MAAYSNAQMLEVFFFYREIALQYLLSGESISFQKIDDSNIVGLPQSATPCVYDALSIRRFQLAISAEKEVNEYPGIEQKLTEILTKAKIALYENNQEKIQKV